MEPKRKGKTIHHLVLKAYEHEGYEIDTTEYRVPRGNTTRDLFNIFDAVGMAPGNFIVGVQLTDRGHMADRRKKVLASERALSWVRCGGHIHVIGVLHRDDDTYELKIEEYWWDPFSTSNPAISHQDTRFINSV